MWAFLIVAVALAVGLTVFPGLPFVGVPVLLLALAVAGAVVLRRRRTGEAQMREFRTQGEQAGPESGSDVQFSARDRNTLS